MLVTRYCMFDMSVRFFTQVLANKITDIIFRRQHEKVYGLPLTYRHQHNFVDNITKA